MCGRHPDNEAAPEGCVNGLRSPGLAASRAPRHVVLPSLRADDSSLGIDGDLQPDNEAAPEGCVNGLRSPGLAASRAPRHVVLPSLRADDSSLGIDGDRPPERARLDPGPGLRPRRLCDLKTKRRFRIAKAARTQ